MSVNYAGTAACAGTIWGKLGHRSLCSPYFCIEKWDIAALIDTYVIRLRAEEAVNGPAFSGCSWGRLHITLLRNTEKGGLLGSQRSCTQTCFTSTCSSLEGLCSKPARIWASLWDLFAFS